MSGAFWCDICQEYHDGDPEQTLYKREPMKDGGPNFTSALDICDTCWAEIEERKP